VFQCNNTQDKIFEKIVEKIIGNSNKVHIFTAQTQTDMNWIKKGRTVYSEEQLDGVPDWHFEKGKLGKVTGKLRTSAKHFEFDSMREAIRYAEKNQEEK
jgi:hypothetical protein